MRFLVLLILALFSTSCGAGSSVRRYEPSMEAVRSHASTLHNMLLAADLNGDERLNWWEALIVLNGWIETIRAQVEAAEAEPGDAPSSISRGMTSCEACYVS